jgi:protein-S-isoprenylcysteine O-methyltransferase Ste14
MFFLWFSWFAMFLNDPIKINLSLLRYFGLLLFIVGVIFVALSHIKIKGYNTKKLYTNGIYSKIRHPMYLGFILWIIGLPMFLQSFITLLSAVIWIPQIMYWKSSEEKYLEKKFTNFEEYKKKTWF